MQTIESDYIKCCDCLEGMRQLPDECIDLTVTSPPYDDLRSYNGYSFDFENIAKELYRVTRLGGCVVWIVNDSTKNGSESGTAMRQALFFKDCGFNLHDTMIWYKDTFSFPEKNRYRQCFEYMFVFSKGKPQHTHLIADRRNKWAGATIHGTSRNVDGITYRKSNDKKSNVLEYGVRFNVWEIPTEKANKTGHPAVFPERLANDHIISWSDVGDIVLDPFLGSGTTAKMAIMNYRHYIGFEISEKYSEIANNRIKTAIADRDKRSAWLDEILGGDENA